MLKDSGSTAVYLSTTAKQLEQTTHPATGGLSKLLMPSAEMRPTLQVPHDSDAGSTLPSPDPDQEFALHAPNPLAPLSGHYLSVSADRRVSLKFARRPKCQQQAQRRSAGRTTIGLKSRTGTAVPMVKLTGYSGEAPVQMQAYICEEEQIGAPHLFFQAAKLSQGTKLHFGEEPREIKLNGTRILQMDIDPVASVNNDGAIEIPLDFMGISIDTRGEVERRIRREQPAIEAEELAAILAGVDRAAGPAPEDEDEKPAGCRLVIRAILPINGQQQVLQIVSDRIYCIRGQMAHLPPARHLAEYGPIMGA